MYSAYVKLICNGIGLTGRYFSDKLLVMVESNYDPDAAPGLLTPPVTWQVASPTRSDTKSRQTLEYHSGSRIPPLRALMSKPRVLIPISLQFSIRYLLRSGLLSQLSASLHPVILLGWKDESLEQELVQAGCEVHPLQKATWGAQDQRARGTMNQWHEQFRKVLRQRSANTDRTLTVHGDRASKESCVPELARCCSRSPGSKSGTNPRTGIVLERYKTQSPSSSS